MQYSCKKMESTYCCNTKVKQMILIAVPILKEKKKKT